MDHIQKLLKVVDAFGGGKMADATISTRVFNDGKRIAILRRGGDIGTRRLQIALQWFSDNWPEDAEWPPLVERPVPRIPAAEGIATPPFPAAAEAQT